MYLVDTNVWIQHLRSKAFTKLSQRLVSTPSWRIKSCSIVRAELMTGVMKSANQARGIAEIESILGPLQSFSFNDESAAIYAAVRADLERIGTPIGGNDLMIAAIALANDLILVTHNTAEFSRVPGLRLEDWQ